MNVDIPWTRCKIRCVETGQIFENMTEAAKFIGCGKSAMSNHLSGRFPHVRGKRFEKIAVPSHEQV